ncbi:heptaprenyl diphosphate synthase component 1 [Neobacillus sp. SM06]|uniref:heptaprenyl diphosphate synthase component 1 n=1 Tax=Neobacillus sp. SM06 TaxID=3422492 RepID=UPI003D2C63AC
MINLQDIRQKLKDIKEQVEQRVTHPYLTQFIQTPIIDEDKLLLLISIMDQLDLPYSQLKNYAVTTMLIQIALDTHETVSNSPVTESEKNSRISRQLTVLAGDYYSGLYYKLLAETSDISLIKILAHGIKEVNEHKISVYQKEYDGIENLMTSIKLIESSLANKIVDYFQVTIWDEVAANFLFVKRLLFEKKQYNQKGNSLVFEGLKKIVFPKNGSKLSDLSNEQSRYLMHICDRYIEFSKNIIEDGIKQLPGISQVLKDRILMILHQHQPIAKSFVEEG